MLLGLLGCGRDGLAMAKQPAKHRNVLRAAPGGASRLRAAALALAGGTALMGLFPATASAATAVNCASGSLQDAISSASPGTTLTVTGTCNGNFVISQNLTLKGTGTAILSGLSGTVLQVAAGATVSVSNLTITGGTAASPSDTGGGIWSAGTLTVSGSTISGNVAGDPGSGGIYNAGTLTLDNSTITDNTMAGNSDGAGISNAGTATIRNSSISGNHASVGGGILNYPAGVLILSNSSVSNNIAEPGEGGGIYNAGGSVRITSSTISGNFGIYGGGIFSVGGAVTLRDSTITGNTTVFAGGGVDNGAGTNNQAAMKVVDTTVSDNAAQYGAGIYNYGQMTLRGSTVSGNTAQPEGSSYPNNGGGIYNDSTGTVKLNDSNVINNTADNDGGGVYNNSGTVILKASVTFSGNMPDNCAPLGSVPGCAS
jgi:hypothetical protein